MRAAVWFDGDSAARFCAVACVGGLSFCAAADVWSPTAGEWRVGTRL